MPDERVAFLRSAGKKSTQNYSTTVAGVQQSSTTLGCECATLHRDTIANEFTLTAYAARKRMSKLARKPNAARNTVDSDSDDIDEDVGMHAAGKVDADGKFSNWASTVQSKPAKVLSPKSATDVQDILAKVCLLP